MCKWLWRGLAGVLLLGAVYVALPWNTARQIVQAAKTEDTAQLQRYIDFPQLRGNLKLSLRHQLQESMGDSIPEELGGLFAAGSDLLIGPLVDQLVTPEAIAEMVQGRRDLRELGKRWAIPQGSIHNRRQPQTDNRAAQAGVDSSGEVSEQQADSSWQLQHWRFESLNRFSADCGDKNTQVRLVLQRQGFFWRLIDIELLTRRQMLSE